MEIMRDRKVKGDIVEAISSALSAFVPVPFRCARTLVTASE